MAIIRQGDVLIVSCEALPNTAMPVKPESGRLIVARGEATGHHHSFPHRRGVTLFRDDGAGGALYVKNTKPVTLEHQEHSALLLTPGTHRVIIQRTATAGLVRRVID